MIGGRWACDCRPIPAVGVFRDRVHVAYLLHGPGCGRPLVWRQTSVYRLAEERR